MGRMKDLNIEVCEKIEYAMKLIDEVKMEMAFNQESDTFMEDQGALCYNKLKLANTYLKNTLKLLNWEG